MSKKIIQIIDSLSVGGAEMMAVNIANSLHMSGVESHLCVTRGEGELKNKVLEDVGYIFLDRKKKIDLKAIFKLRSYIKKHDINIIHAHSSSFFTAICVKLIYPLLKVVWHDHYGKSDFINDRPYGLLKLFSRFFDQIISVNNILKIWGEQKLRHKKVCYLPNFATLQNYNNQSTKLKGSNEKKILILAGLRPQKDHLNLLKAYKLLVEKTDCSLHIVGKDYGDNYSKEIHKYIKDKQLQKVYFYGACGDVKNILEQTDLAVLSSNSEGLPVALLEYGLAKLPVVVTNVGQCSDVIENDITGKIVKSNSSVELCEAIQSLLSDIDLANKVSERLFEKINENYSEKAFTNRIIQIYESI